jgi:pimeloyl-ACP methyl ester carboxylesterase
VKRKGDLAHAVSFLPGYPDGSFGWAKVLPHLPNATEMPKLFVEYVGMGDSDKPKDYPYSTAELSQWPIPGSGTSITTHFVTRRGNSIRIISSGSIEGRPMSL